MTLKDCTKAELLWLIDWMCTHSMFRHDIEIERAFRRLVDVYGGTGRVYIPQADTLLIPIRDRLIREEYNGYNVYELCKKWDLGESMVRTIIRDKIRELRQAPIDGQVSLFDVPETE